MSVAHGKWSEIKSSTYVDADHNGTAGDMATKAE